MSLHVFVIVGTHEQPFDRLLSVAEYGAQILTDTEWVVQHGVGAFESDRVMCTKEYFAHDEIREWNSWADVVLSHASPGAVFDALSADAQPIVVPRRRLHGEHVNDHQVQFAARLEALGLAQVAAGRDEAVDLLRAACSESATDRRSRLATIYAASRARSEAFVSAFGDVMTDLEAGRRPQHRV